MCLHRISTGLFWLTRDMIFCLEPNTDRDSRKDGSMCAFLPGRKVYFVRQVKYVRKIAIIGVGNVERFSVVP